MRGINPAEEQKRREEQEKKRQIAHEQEELAQAVRTGKPISPEILKRIHDRTIDNIATVMHTASLITDLTVEKPYEPHIKKVFQEWGLNGFAPGNPGKEKMSIEDLARAANTDVDTYKAKLQALDNISVLSQQLRSTTQSLRFPFWIAGNMSEFKKDVLNKDGTFKQSFIDLLADAPNMNQEKAQDCLRRLTELAEYHSKYIEKPDLAKKQENKQENKEDAPKALAPVEQKADSANKNKSQTGTSFSLEENGNLKGIFKRSAKDADLESAEVAFDMQEPTPKPLAPRGYTI